MATQKPLVQMIPDILVHIEKYRDFLQFNLKIYEVLEGQLRTEVEKSLRKELFSYKAFERARERIPSINILRKATDKLSKVYIESPVRITNNSTDQKIMDNIVNQSGLNSVLYDSNRILNAQNMTAIEPFVQDGKIQYRVLAGHQFLPYSDDPVNPMNMTVFIKLLGTETKEIGPVYSTTGVLLQPAQIREVDVFALYSDSEWIIIDSGGSIREDKMLAMGATSNANPYGRIPVVYRSKSNLQLIPFPNREGYDIAILIPKLLADLNYAAQFLSHSILWTKNANLGEQELNPDVVLDLGDKPSDGGDPEIGTVEPKVDIPNVISLIEYQLHAYFESIGIKSGSSGMLSAGSDASGVAKAIDESDTSSERKVQSELYRSLEAELWELTSVVQNTISTQGGLEDKRKFSNNFSNNVRIKFAEMRPFKTEKQILEEIQMWREQKLMTRKQAIRQLRPDFNDEQLDNWIKELDEEGSQELDNMMNGLPSFGSERKSDGTFNENNDAATNKDLTDSTEKING